MKKYLQIGLVAVVALMLGATLTMADPRSDMFVVQRPDVQQGQIYNRDLISVQDPNPRPTQLPAPQDPDTAAGVMPAVSKPGPSMFDGFKSDMGGLAPNVGVRGGGGMMSARQQADRQIGKLIRRLN